METPDRGVMHFKLILEGTFNEHYNIDLHKIKYRLFDHLEADVRKSGTLSILEGSPNELFNLHIELSHRRILEKRQTSVIETFIVLRKAYQSVLECEKKKIGEELLAIDVRYVLNRRNDPYPSRDVTTTTMKDLSQTVDGREGIVSYISPLVVLLNQFREITVQRVFVLVHEIAVEGKENFPISDVWLASVKSGYLVVKYFSTLRAVN